MPNTTERERERERGEREMGESGLIMLEQDDTCSSSREGRIGFKDTGYIQFLGKKEVQI